MIKYMILVLSFTLATELGTSFSVRTPNDDSKPLDYEVSIKFEDTNGDFKYLVKRDWERELGQKYVDDILQIQHKPIGYLYYGIDYVDKQSKSISYTTYNLGADIGYFKGGVSFKEIENNIKPLLNLALYSKAITKDLEGNPDIEYNVSISIKSDIGENNIFNLKSEVKKWLTSSINIFGLYKHEYYNDQEDFQFKIGLGVKL